MNFLLDTHTFLWLLADPLRLSEAVKQIVLDPKNELHLSAASYWEICIKINIGKLKLGKNWPKSLESGIEENLIRWLPISPEHCQTLVNLPLLHRDPFDRLLISQAQVEHLTIISVDSKFSQYDVSIVW